MFKDLPEGQTHYENDGCGEPAHSFAATTEMPVGRYFYKGEYDGGFLFVLL